MRSSSCARDNGTPGCSSSGAPCTPAHQRADTRREFVEVEGLDQVIVGAGVESAHAVGDRVARGDHQHGHGEAALAQRGEQFETGFPGQAQVEQHQFVHRVGQREFGRAAVLDPVDAVTLLAQPVVYGGADHRVIFNEQQAHHHSRKPPVGRQIALMV